MPTNGPVSPRYVTIWQSPTQIVWAILVRPLRVTLRVRATDVRQGLVRLFRATFQTLSMRTVPFPKLVNEVMVGIQGPESS
jgi:hypothetical protein